MGAAGRRGRTKNAVRRYYGVLNINFRPKTSNYFISVAFFEKITPLLVNKKSDDANTQPVETVVHSPDFTCLLQR